MKTTTALLQPSKKENKKLMVTVFHKDGSKKTIHFGGKGYSDFTRHKDKDRMKRYEIRHKSRENWNKAGIKTSGVWAKWMLWSKPSLTSAIRYTENKFNIKIKTTDSMKKYK